MAFQIWYAETLSSIKSSHAFENALGHQAWQLTFGMDNDKITIDKYQTDLVAINIDSRRKW